MTRGLRFFVTACVVVLCGAAADRAGAAEPAAEMKTLRGAIDRVEADRFEVDSAWVEPSHHARFNGRAHQLRDLRVGMWARVEGRFDKHGTFVADWIVTSHLFPGHRNQQIVEEQAYGERTRLQESGALCDVPEVNRYVAFIGDAVVPEWSRRKFDFRFEVLSDPGPNAFALPDGTIFVSTGLLASLENDAQLAVILGHEVAHVTEHHGARGVRKKRALVFTNRLVQEALDEAAEEDKGLPVVEFAASIGLDAVIAAAIEGYDRAYEDQADRVGLRYAVEAGFDPATAPGIWGRLNQRGADAGVEGKYFYLNRVSNAARKRNLEDEIRLHYGDPTKRPAARPSREDEYGAMILLLPGHGAAAP